MTIDEAIFCMESYLSYDDLSCTRCKYYRNDTCQSRTAHKIAISALKDVKNATEEAEWYLDRVKKYEEGENGE